MTLLLFLGAAFEKNCGTRHERRILQSRRIIESGQFLVEHPMMCTGQSLAAVLAGEADSGESGVEEHALQFAFARDRGEFLLVQPSSAPRRQ